MICGDHALSAGLRPEGKQQRAGNREFEAFAASGQLAAALRLPEKNDVRSVTR
jgi:hypothetical protein